jgi:hypothetical protein
MPDGTLRVVKCSTPDTYFSIPARVAIKGKTVKGFITSDDVDGGPEREYTFNPNKF